MQQWEYTSDTQLDEIGRAGWELVSVTTTPTRTGDDAQNEYAFEAPTIGHFKRPKGLSDTGRRILGIATRVGA